MAHSIYKVISLKILSPYTIEIKFDDGSYKKINFEKVLNGEMYSPFKDLELFNKVYIDPEVHTIAWPNGADFDPSTLHNWDEYEDELEIRAKEWDAIGK